MNNVRRLVPGWFATMIAASAAICVIGLSQPQHPTATPDTAACSCPAQRLGSDTPADAENTRELMDALWLDRVPEMASDTFHAYSFSSENIGIFMDFHSQYKLTLELFEFKANNSNITYHFPHDSRKGQFTYKVEKLKKPTNHFDKQLTIEKDPNNGGKTTVYYSGPNFRSLNNLPSPLGERLEAAGVTDLLDR